MCLYEHDMIRVAEIGCVNRRKLNCQVYLSNCLINVQFCDWLMINTALNSSEFEWSLVHTDESVFFDSKLAV